MRKIIYQHRIYRSDLKANPDATYLFGDNLMGIGMGGQAGEMRHEPNAVGVPTKKAPGNAPLGEYFTDDEYEDNVIAIDRALAKIPLTCHIVVIPSDGLGTGLAELDKRAPRTFTYLQERLKFL